MDETIFDPVASRWSGILPMIRELFGKEMDLGFLLVAFAIMIFFGGFGGILGAVVDPGELRDGQREAGSTSEAIASRMRIALGVGAAMLVPFFLLLIHSDILSEANKDMSKLLSFSALCLLSGMFSRRFIRAMSAQLLSRLDRLESEAQLDQDKLDFVLELQRKQPQLDARALEAVEEHLDEDSESPLPSDEISGAIAAASEPARNEIFAVARDFRRSATPSHKGSIEKVIPIFEGLIAAAGGDQFHRNFGQLGCAVKDQTNPDWERARDLFTKAIRVRKTTGRKGFRRYEFERAICKMMYEIEANPERQSEDSITASIVEDLRVTLGRATYDDRLRDFEGEFGWLGRHNIDPNSLEPRPDSAVGTSEDSEE